MVSDEKILDTGSEYKDTRLAAYTPVVAIDIVRCPVATPAISAKVESLLRQAYDSLPKDSVIVSVSAPNCVPVGKVDDGDPLWLISVGLCIYNDERKTKAQDIPEEVQEVIDRVAATGGRVHFEPPSGLGAAMARVAANAEAGRPARVVPSGAASSPGLPIAGADNLAALARGSKSNIQFERADNKNRLAQRVGELLAMGGDVTTASSATVETAGDQTSAGQEAKAEGAEKQGVQGQAIGPEVASAGSARRRFPDVRDL